jgi:enterochelin esterase-like enzyme
MFALTKKSMLFLLLGLAFLITACNTNSNTTSSQPLLEEVKVPLAQSEIRKIKFHSKALNQEMNMSVYLPKGYTTDKTYPVLYMLHIYGANHAWVFNTLKMNQNADKLIEEGQVEPFLIVTPHLYKSFGLNTTDRGNYEDFLTQDVIEYVQSHYSAANDKSKRWIGGMSMGGYASLYTAIRNPDLFGRVGAHGPAIFTPDQKNEYTEFLYPDDETRKKRDPIILAKFEKVDGIQIYMDSGENDEFLPGIKLAHDALKANNAQLSFRVSPGGHDSVYWSEHIDEYIKFYASAK